MGQKKYINICPLVACSWRFAAFAEAAFGAAAFGVAMPFKALLMPSIRLYKALQSSRAI